MQPWKNASRLISQTPRHNHLALPHFFGASSLLRYRLQVIRPRAKAMAITASLPLRPVGAQGLKASAQGLGCMGMVSLGYQHCHMWIKLSKWYRSTGVSVDCLRRGLLMGSDRSLRRYEKPSQRRREQCRNQAVSRGNGEFKRRSPRYCRRLWARVKRKACRCARP